VCSKDVSVISLVQSATHLQIILPHEQAVSSEERNHVSFDNAAVVSI